MCGMRMVCVHLLLFFVCVYVCVHVISSSVLHLLEELVGWVLVTILLHL